MLVRDYKVLTGIPMTTTVTDQNLKLIRAKADHDLRSNLNVVLGFSAMLREEFASQKLGGPLEDLDCITAAGREVLHLTDQIEDLTRLQHGTWTDTKKNFELQKLLEDVAESITEQYANHEVCVSESAVSKNYDENELAINRIFDLVVSSMCKSTHRGAKIEATITDVGIHIECGHSELDTMEVNRLHANLERLTTPIIHMSDIRDFEAYYLTTLCASTDIRVTKIKDQLAIRMELCPTQEARTSKNENLP